MDCNQELAGPCSVRRVGQVVETISLNGKGEVSKVITCQLLRYRSDDFKSSLDCVFNFTIANLILEARPDLVNVGDKTLLYMRVIVDTSLDSLQNIQLWSGQRSGRFSLAQGYLP